MEQVKHAKQQHCSENRKPHFIAAKFRHSRMDISFRADVHALLTLETFSRRLDRTALWKSQFCRTVFRACPASFDAVFTLSCQCQERQCRKQGKDCTHRTEKTAEKASIILIDKKADNDDGMMDKELEAAAIGNKIIEMVQGENPLYVWGKQGYHRVTYSNIVILL